MASTETNTSESDSINKCPFCESSLQSSTETVLDALNHQLQVTKNVVTQKGNIILLKD